MAQVARGACLPANRRLGSFVNKKHSRKPSISHEDAFRQAICYGWIDGVIKRLDPERTLRKFTRRKSESLWSPLNICRAQELISSGEMTPAGLLVYKPERKCDPGPVVSPQKTIKLFTGTRPREVTSNPFGLMTGESSPAGLCKEPRNQA